MSPSHETGGVEQPGKLDEKESDKQDEVVLEITTATHPL